MCITKWGILISSASLRFWYQKIRYQKREEALDEDVSEAVIATRCIKEYKAPF